VDIPSFQHCQKNLSGNRVDNVGRTRQTEKHEHAATFRDGLVVARQGIPKPKLATVVGGIKIAMDTKDDNLV
jgi:hypothetical protein